MLIFWSSVQVDPGWGRRPLLDINRLIDQVQEAAADRKYADLLSSERTKIVVGLGSSVLSKVLGFNLKDWFFDPKFYQDISDLVKGKIPVTFPGWARGPWSIACMLRGFTPLYVDLIDDPDFEHRLMQFIVDARIHFETQRCRFLGIDLQ